MANAPRPSAEEIVGGSWRPGRGWLAVMAVVGLLFGYVLTHRDRVGAPAAGPNGPLSAAPATPAAGPPDSTSGPRVGLGPAGLRLLVGGTSPRILDAATGRSSPLILPTGGTRAVVWLARSRQSVLAFVDPPAAGSTAPSRIAYLVRPGAAPVRLGAADHAVAAWDGGAVTLAGTRLTGYAGDGTPWWQRRSARPIELAVDTRYGLVVHEIADPLGANQVGRLLLVDPATGEVRRELASRVSTVLTASDEQVAWLGIAACPADCAVRISSLATGAVRTVGDYFGRAPVAGAFSPDERLLALSFVSGPGRPAASGDGLVGVIDVAAGSIAVVQGYGDPPYPPAWVDWTPDGRLVLMLNTPVRDRVRVAVSAIAGAPDGFTLLPWSFRAQQSLDLGP